MDIQQAKLYQLIQEFPLDDADAALPFSKRLAQDNGWTAKYTQHAIDEYKKFVFLAVAAGHPVSPSDQVDQVWHLHLVYTHSYWGEFCPNVLQMPLHHGPTRGGKSEHHKLNTWYSKTLASYEHFFEQTPSADVWPRANLRFGRDLHFLRVNTQQNWILPKPSRELLPKFHLNRQLTAVLLFVVALAVTGCEPSTLGNIKSPLDFTGPQFLRFYLSLASTVTLFGCALRWYLRQPGASPSNESVSLNTYETAYLAGGKDRAVDAAIARLVQLGNLKPQPKLQTLTLETPLPGNSHLLERELEQVFRGGASIKQARASVTNATNQIRNCLQSLGLLASNSKFKASQQVPALGVFAVLLLGISKIFVGISRGKPVGFLVALCIITAIIGCYFLFRPVLRSRYGDRVLADLYARHAGFKQTTKNSTMADSQLLLAFALFGTGVLAGSSLADLRQMLIPPPSSASGGGGGCGGGGCGGGCGGGGGGGCGGCGG